jgi:hypothetical protein
MADKRTGSVSWQTKTPPYHCVALCGNCTLLFSPSLHNLKSQIASVSDSGKLAYTRNVCFLGASCHTGILPFSIRTFSGARTLGFVGVRLKAKKIQFCLFTTSVFFEDSGMITLDVSATPFSAVLWTCHVATGLISLSVTPSVLKTSILRENAELDLFDGRQKNWNLFQGISRSRRSLRRAEPSASSQGRTASSQLLSTR